MVDLGLLAAIAAVAVLIGYRHHRRMEWQKYVTALKKEDFLLESPAGRKLRFFYEPRPSRTETERPAWLEHEVTNRINADGINSLSDFDIRKPGSVYRIVAIGDSHTFGQYVDTGRNWTDLLARHLNAHARCTPYAGFEVINLGVGGYDIEYTLERFRNRGAKYKPDLVLWLIGPVDFTKSNELMGPLRKKLEEQGVPVFDPATRTYPQLMMADEAFKNAFGEDFAVEYQRRRLMEAGRLFDAGLLIVNYAPLRGKMSPIIRDFVKLDRRYQYAEGIIDYAKLSRLPDGHPDARGYEQISEALLNYLCGRLKNDAPQRPAKRLARTHGDSGCGCPWVPPKRASK